jgi:hypothetical protein
MPKKPSNSICIYCNSFFVKEKKMKIETTSSSFLMGLSLLKNAGASMGKDISSHSEFLINHENFKIYKCENCGIEYLLLNRQLVKTLTKDILDKTNFNPARKEYIMELINRYEIKGQDFLKNTFAVTLPKYVGFMNSIKNKLMNHKEVNIFFKNHFGSSFYLVLSFNKNKLNYTLDNIQPSKVMRL